MRERVEDALNQIRPALQADGGDIELIDVNEAEGVVKVRLVGACAGCPMSAMTLRNGVEQVLRRSVPEMKRLDAVM